MYLNSKVFQDALAEAMIHCDAKGIPADSLARGLVQVELVCNAIPELEQVFRANWPNPTS